MNKFVWLFGLIVLFLIPLVSAVPPLLSTASIEQLQITPKLLDSYKIKTEISLEYHVYNASGYIVTNNTAGLTTCEIHLYNPNGTHFLRDKLIYDQLGDWEFKLTSSNTTNLGAVPYNIYCYNSIEAGWLASNFYITEQGQGLNAPVDRFPNYDLVMVFGLIGIAFFLVYFSDKFKLEGESFIKVLTSMLINLLFKLTAFSVIIYDIFIIRTTMPSITVITDIYDQLVPLFVYGIGLIFFVLYFINAIATLVYNFNIYKQKKKDDDRGY